VLLNKADLIDREVATDQKPVVRLSCGRELEASMVSFASEDSSHNIDKVNSKLKQVLKEHGLSKETLGDS